MKNLLHLDDLSVNEIKEIVQLALKLKQNKIKKQLTGKTIANLFLENSTRTHYSFVQAENKLNIKYLDFAASASSMNKGETLYDTIKVFDSLQVDAIIVRSAVDQWYKQVLGKVNAKLINAGDGKSDHPTQTLLDLLTIYEQFKKFAGLKVLIVGDIVHSRVAHSNYNCFKRLGMEVYFAAPNNLKDKAYRYEDLDTYLPKVDVVNMLRIQNERLEKGVKIQSNYNQVYGLNMKRVNKMKKNAIIIHPAPVNRNVEVNDDVVECKKSRIFAQMTNGMYVRMAVLTKILESKK